MLMERRTVEDLEAVLAERLEVVKERRALEARAIADVASRRSALSLAGDDPGIAVRARRPSRGIRWC
jgi:hypothetical protein